VDANVTAKYTLQSPKEGCGGYSSSTVGVHDLASRCPAYPMHWACAQCRRTLPRAAHLFLPGDLGHLGRVQVCVCCHHRCVTKKVLILRNKSIRGVQPVAHNTNFEGAVSTAQEQEQPCGGQQPRRHQAAADASQTREYLYPTP